MTDNLKEPQSAHMLVRYWVPCSAGHLGYGWVAQRDTRWEAESVVHLEYLTALWMGPRWGHKTDSMTVHQSEVRLERTKAAQKAVPLGNWKDAMSELRRDIQSEPRWDNPRE